MDSFSNNKQKPRINSTDGFISGSIGTPRYQQPRPLNGGASPTGTLGNFRSADGFHPSQQAQITTAAPPLSSHHQPEHIRLHASLPVSKPIERRRRRSRRLPKMALKSFGILLITSLVFGGYLFGKGYLKAKQIFKGGGGAAALQENVDPSQLRGEGDGRVNILMLGRGGLGHDGADLTDTILIASINPIQKEAALLSIPRDFYVQSGGSYTKINAVYAYAKNQELARLPSSDSNRDKKADEAGLKAMDNMIESTIGIPIHYHAIVDFTGFKEAVDTVGGIDIDVPPELSVAELMSIDGKKYNLNVKGGQQHFDGFRALAFARTRYTSARGDFDRSERQRLILVALKNRVLSAGTFGNPLKINQLIDNFGDHISANMTTDEVMRLYNIGKDIDSSKVASVGLADPPNNYITTASMNGLSVVIPRAGLGNYKEIQAYIRNRLKDGFLAQENATVAIYNGTNIPGLAARTAEDLKSYGYSIGQVADAPTKGYGQTVVVDMRGGAKKYTKHYLENRFSVSTVSAIPDQAIIPGTADFVIILGQNEASRLDR